MFKPEDGEKKAVTSTSTSSSMSSHQIASPSHSPAKKTKAPTAKSRPSRQAPPPPSHPSIHIAPPPCQPCTRPSSQPVTKPSLPPQGYPASYPFPLFMHSWKHLEASKYSGHVQEHLQKTDRNEPDKQKRKGSTNMKKDKLLSTKNIDGIKRDTNTDTTSESAESNKAEKTSTDPKIRSDPKAVKHKLQITAQTSVNIPRENVHELLPGISISPREPQSSVQPQQKYKVVRIVHENSQLEKPSSASNTNRVEGDMAPETTDRSKDENREVLESPRDTDRTKLQKNNEKGVASDDGHRDSGNLIIVSPSHSVHAVSTGENPVAETSENHEASVTGEKMDEEKCHSHIPNSEPHGTQTSDSYEPQIIYIIDHDEGNRNPLSDHVPGNGDDGTKNGNLPGNMPEVMWTEVPVEDNRYENNDEDTREKLHEAEERLYYHDLRLRILHR